MDNTDLRLVQDFLDGNSKAAKKIEKVINGALSVWREKLGYQYDDVKSDVSYKLLVSLKRGDFEYRAKLATFISRIVNHTCIDYIRYNRKFNKETPDELSLPLEILSQEEQLEKKQLLNLCFRVMRLVPQKCRQLWRMYIGKEMNCREIGDILGESEGSIRRQMWVCRTSAKKIREKLLKKDKQFNDSDAGIL